MKDYSSNSPIIVRIDCQDSPSEPEENNFSRVSQLRKQRYIPSQSPVPQPPPPFGSMMAQDPGHGSPSHASSGPPKPPRTSFTDSRKLGDGGVASDGEVGSHGGGNGRKQPKRRESHSRRHTLQNGIDYGLVIAIGFKFIILTNTRYFSSRR